MGKNPGEAMQKYGHNPDFREMMQEYAQLMSGHFEDIGKEKIAEQEKEKAEKEKEIANDPVMKIIQNDPQVKEILQDQEV